MVAYDLNKSKNCLRDLDRSINCLVARLYVKRKRWAGGVNLGKKSRAPKSRDVKGPRSTIQKQWRYSMMGMLKEGDCIIPLFSAFVSIKSPGRELNPMIDGLESALTPKRSGARDEFPFFANVGRNPGSQGRAVNIETIAPR